jgi:hypothetical protein
VCRRTLSGTCIGSTTRPRSCVFCGTTRRIHAFRNQLLANMSRPMGKKVLTSLTSRLRDARRRDASAGMSDKKTTPLFVVCSPCRCVGKTLVSRLLAEFYVVNDRPVAAFDLADEGPQLAEYLPNITTIADISDTRGQMALFDRLLAEKDTPVVIDVSYRAFKDFFTVVQEIHFFQEARHRFIEPLILFIIDPNPKSANAYATLRHWLSEAPLVPVRNQTEAGAIQTRPPVGQSSAPVSLSRSQSCPGCTTIMSGYDFRKGQGHCASDSPPSPRRCRRRTE